MAGLTLDETVKELKKRYEHPFQNEVYTLVVARMFMEMLESGKTYFAGADIKRHLLRVYISGDADRAANVSEISRNTLALMKKLVATINAAEGGKLTTESIEERILAADPKYQPKGDNSELMAIQNLEYEASDFLSYLKIRKATGRLPYLDNTMARPANHDMRQGTRRSISQEYLLVIR